ncbi:hypothetical protein GCM10023211_12380 [Orbus sasakiae]|uniref:Uncharacterized protein n=1 Tax=Orbus sasakiae TaxID=1078475 RepID=A0ABP9N7G1_9GAMM
MGLVDQGNTINGSAALSATTVNTIIGHGPQYTGTADTLGFSVSDTQYSEATGNISSDTTKTFQAGLTFNDFVVNTSLIFTATTDYTYSDGDSADPDNPVSLDGITYSWVDAAGTAVATSSYSTMIGCDGSYTYPLTLQITATNIKTFSQYGDPRESSSVTLTKSYKISPVGICYAKPYAIETLSSTQWYGFDSSGSYKGINVTNYTTPNVTVGGGYTSDNIPDKGFKANPTVSSNNFPTTGFPGAKFQLVMAGNQNDYNFSVNSGNGVTTADGSGYVRFTSKPSGSVTIRATLNSDSSIYYDYTFNPTGNWVVSQSKTVTSKSYTDASKICTNLGTSLPTRENLTNSPQISVSTMTTYITNSWTRAIGGGITGEWGPLNTTSYPNSDWPSTTDFVYYWTSESSSSVAQFVVSNTWGDVNYSGLSGSGNYRYVACKG